MENDIIYLPDWVSYVVAVAIIGIVAITAYLIIRGIIKNCVGMTIRAGWITLIICTANCNDWQVPTRLILGLVTLFAAICWTKILLWYKDLYHRYMLHKERKKQREIERKAREEAEAKERAERIERMYQEALQASEEERIRKAQEALEAERAQKEKEAREAAERERELKEIADNAVAFEAVAQPTEPAEYEEYQISENESHEPAIIDYTDVKKFVEKEEAEKAKYIERYIAAQTPEILINKNIEFERFIPSKNITEQKKGREYEYYVARRMEKMGYLNTWVTPQSNDYGADVIAYTPTGKKVGVQCKYYNKKIGKDALQEILAAKSYYDFDIVVVVTNNTFTKNAIKIAKKTCVELWKEIY